MAQPEVQVAAGAVDLPGPQAGRPAPLGPGLIDLALSETALRRQEREIRAALARELHDRVAQPLTGLLLDLEQLKRTPADRRRLRQRIDIAQDQVRQAICGLRQVLCELREQEWLDDGFTSRLRGELESVVLRQPDLDLRLRVSPRWPASIRARAAHHLLHVVRESVHNARLHGRAGRVEVSLTLRAGRALLAVSDDGQGLEGRPGRAGMGLLGAHERATLLGGRLTVTARPGGGTQVRLAIPKEVLG